MAAAPPPLVICGPSGVGKGTLIDRLMKKFPGRFGFSVSHTTRSPRPGEIDGKHYHFTDLNSMQAQVAAGDFLEHANVHGTLYGTSFASVDAVGSRGQICILDIDVQGAQQVKLKRDAKFIFISPPSADELERRLRGRGTETEEKIQVRLRNASGEIAFKDADPSFFDGLMVNDDVEASTKSLNDFVVSWYPSLAPAPANLPLVICGPSGVGKGTLIDRLMKKFPDSFGFSVSHTTRAPRPGEIDGKHYHFTDVETMEKQIAAGDFLEHANVHGTLYGTSFASVDAVGGRGQICILDIDVQGAQQVKLKRDAKFIFISPPSADELERRLRGRGTETEEKIQVRLKNAAGEIAFKDSDPSFFDGLMVNEDLEASTRSLYDFVFSWYPSLAPAPANLPLVICGPSGVGKGTLIDKLMKLFPNRFGFSVSHTTRAPRPGEIDGKHYHFTNVETMEKQIAAGDFLEHANVHGTLYGTSFASVDAVGNRGQVCILDIDVQGAQQIKLKRQAKFIFISPPSLQELEERLRGRGTETEEKIQVRLKNAVGELDFRDKSPGFFDCELLNDDLNSTAARLTRVVAQWNPDILQFANDQEVLDNDSLIRALPRQRIATLPAGQVGEMLHVNRLETSSASTVCT